MKDKVLTLIIGILIGAVITAAGFLIYSKVNEDDTNEVRGGGEMQEMDGNFTGGGMQMDGNMTPGDAPEKPDGDEETIPETEDSSSQES